MYYKFIPTTNAQLFLDGVSELNNRGAREACFMILDGEPGSGKTNVARWWAIQNHAIYLRAKIQWTPRWLLEEILINLNITPAHRYTERYGQVVSGLAQKVGSSFLQNTEFGIIIDEADHIVRRRDILETLRDLSDELEIPFILVGMGKIRTALIRYPQVASRIAKFVHFKDNDEVDTSLLAKGMIDVKIAPDLLSFLHRVSCGRVREVLEGLKSIDLFANRNNLIEIQLADMVGVKLLNDRSTGREIKIKEHYYG